MTDIEGPESGQEKTAGQLFTEEVAEFLLPWEYEEKETLIHGIALRIDAWRDTANPFFIERAFQMAVGELHITATLAVELECAIRFRRQHHKGTWGQVKRWEWKSRGFLIMCHLLYHGATLSDAASIVQRQIDVESGGETSLKVSTWQKDYEDEWRRPGLEGDLHAYWQEVKSEKDWEEWQKFYISAERAPRNATTIGSRRGELPPDFS